LKAAESTLGSIRGIKMMVLTKSISRAIQSLRVQEILLAMNYRKLEVTSIVICKFYQHGPTAHKRKDKF
jgi:hypothetical protein